MNKRISSLVLAALLLAGGLAATVRGADTTTVSLRIEGSSQTLFSGSVQVTECDVTDTAGAVHHLPATAACALVAAAEQAHFDYVFQDFGFGLFLKQIGADDTPADFSKSWGFWINDDPASVGVDSYTVAAGDKLLLAFSAYPGVPLRVTVPLTTPVQESVTATVTKRLGDFDADYIWHGRWEAAEGATLHIGSETVTVPESGTVTITRDEPATLEVYADGEGYIRSAAATLAVTAAEVTATPTPEPTETVTPTPTATPTPTTIASNRQEQAKKALQYLRKHQADNGEIDGAITSAWSAIAFGTREERATAIKSGEQSLAQALEQASLTSATDLERQLLARRAAGLTIKGSEELSRLKKYFDGKQIGEANLINDDIFGVLALLAADEPVSSAIITKTVQNITSHQADDGSWENLDITAAAIQALRAYQKRGGSISADVLTRATEYLQSHQDKFGGWGENSATTSWVLQALIAMGKDTPWEALTRYQNSSGGFGWKSNTDVSAFMTAYAVPALLGVPWPVTTLSTETVAPILTVTVTPSPKPVVKKSATVASSIVATVTPTATPGPRVAGASTDEAVEVTESTITPAPEPSIAPAPSSSVAPPAPIIPVTTTDRQFTLTLFSLGNIGIGVALARLLSKLGIL